MSNAQFKLADPIQFLGLGFGSGLSPKAPGTFGTLAAIPLFLLLSNLATSSYVLLVIIMSLIGIVICQKTADAVNVHDHPAIVWDEIAGFMVTMLFVPVTWQTVVAGFVLFRLFDIVKPWPISWLDKHCHGGFGIMIDDIVAGILACACLHLIF